MIRMAVREYFPRPGGFRPKKRSETCPGGPCDCRDFFTVVAHLIRNRTRFVERYPEGDW
jgi:hypothetical protein